MVSWFVSQLLIQELTQSTKHSTHLNPLFIRKMNSVLPVLCVVLLVAGVTTAISQLKINFFAYNVLALL